LNYHWGLALIKLERWDEAENRFRKTVEVDPNHTGGYQGLAHALLKQGRAKEAIRFAWRAAKLTDFAATDVLITLAEVYAEAGKISEAAAAATKAIEIEHNGGPQMGFYVRSRLDEIVSRAGH
jgi:tetratricopeptide (TPR) repeat protein